jgi:membrane peptidoglycan carboxypeptidase
MGEHTIRELLRRRSPETQRALKRRREIASGERESHTPKIIGVVVLVGIIAGVGYLFYVAGKIGERFSTSQQTRHSATTLTLQTTSAFLPNTLLASLDVRFYSEGAGSSGITRRLVQVYVPDVGPFDLRVMATTLEWRHSKNDILEAYINDVPMGQANGHTLRGFGEAAQLYFDKPFDQLEPQDVALLVALVSDPAGLDPRNAPDKALAARNAVLDLDQQQGILRQSQVAEFKLKPLGISPKAVL